MASSRSMRSGSGCRPDSAGGCRRSIRPVQNHFYRGSAPAPEGHRARCGISARRQSPFPRQLPAGGSSGCPVFPAWRPVQPSGGPGAARPVPAAGARATCPRARRCGWYSSGAAPRCPLWRRHRRRPGTAPPSGPPSPGAACHTGGRSAAWGAPAGSPAFCCRPWSWPRCSHAAGYGHCPAPRTAPQGRTPARCGCRQPPARGRASA